MTIKVGDLVQYRGTDDVGRVVEILSDDELARVQWLGLDAKSCASIATLVRLRPENERTNDVDLLDYARQSLQVIALDSATLVTTKDEKVRASCGEAVVAAVERFDLAARLMLGLERDGDREEWEHIRATMVRR